MMRQISKQNAFILICSACLYCLNRFLLKRIIQAPVISYVLKCHFNDFIAGIAILAYINFILSISRYHSRKISTFPEGISITFICGLLWEYLIPIIIPHGTSDFLDVLSYMTGGATYILLSRIIAHRKRNNRIGDDKS